MRKKILIGFLNRENKGAIPIITRAFMEGLRDKYEFIPFYLDRRRRNIQSRINLTNIYYLFKHYLQWIKSIMANRPDIVHYPVTSYWNLEKSLLFLSTARIMGVKTVIGHLHGGAFDRFWEELGSIRKMIAVRQLEKLDGFIVLSEYWEKFFEKKVHFQSINFVNNPISAEFEDYFKEFSRDYSKEEILFVGALGKRKGIYDLLESLKNRSSGPTVNLVGPEADRGDLKRIMNIIEEYGLENINIPGSKYGEEKRDIFRNSGIFIFPSHNENFPLVIIEAACTALPIITTPVGALPEFFEHKTDIYFVEPGNIGEIIKAIDYMASNQEERARIGKQARKVFEEKLSRDRIMKQLDKVYTEVSK